MLWSRESSLRLVHMSIDIIKSKAKAKLFLVQQFKWLIETRPVH